MRLYLFFSTIGGVKPLKWGRFLIYTIQYQWATLFCCVSSSWFFFDKNSWDTRIYVNIPMCMLTDCWYFAWARKNYQRHVFRKRQNYGL